MLLFNFFLLLSKFVLHSLKLLGKELILLPELLSSDSKLLVLLSGIDKRRSDSAKFLFAAIDLVHVLGCFESTFFN